MNVFEAIRTRRSIRRYQNKPIEEEKLQQILEAGRLAPSSANRQEWRFVVARDAETRMRLMSAAKNQPFVGQAPVVVALKSIRWPNWTANCGHWRRKVMMSRYSCTS